MIDPSSRFEAEVLKVLNRALTSLDYEPVERLLEAPPGKGDFSFPCFKSAAEHERKPPELAKQLAYVIEDNPYIDKVVAIGPYLNFYLAPVKFAEEVLKAILDNDEDHGGAPSKDMKVVIEHTSANPTGPFHVGRARNPILGDSISRTMRKAGYDVETQYWVNDMGKQAVILAYGLERCEGGESERDKADHKATVNYRQANELMEKDPKAAEDISEWIRSVERGDPEIVGKVKDASKKVLEGMKESLIRLNVKMDRFVWESQYLDFEGMVHGRSPRFFFTRGDGTTLYTTRDVAYHIWKLASCDLAINILGEDHKLEALYLEHALKALGSDKVPEVVFYSFVSLPSSCPECRTVLDDEPSSCPNCGKDVSDKTGKKEKMSTRKGKAVYIDDLIDEAVERALVVVTEKRKDLSEEDRKRIAELVGVGALRFNIIRVQADKSMVFKWDEALNFEGRSAPFIQYAHARASSILREAGSYGMWSSEDLRDKGEFEMVKVLAKFPGLVKRCAELRQAYPIAEYAHEVATQFNKFYRDYRVIGSETQATRLAVVDAARWVLRNSLELLGIVAPDHM